MRAPDVGQFIANIEGSSLPCFWYGAAPMSVARLEEALSRIAPVMAQLFGQTEAPMMISTLSPSQHFNDDGSVAAHRLSSAGRPKVEQAIQTHPDVQETAVVGLPDDKWGERVVAVVQPARSKVGKILKTEIKGRQS